MPRSFRHNMMGFLLKNYSCSGIDLFNVCFCVCRRTHAWMGLWKPEVGVGPLSFSILVLGTGSALSLELTPSGRLAGQWAPRSHLPLPPTGDGFTDVHPAFPWVPRIQIQTLMIVQHALCPVRMDFWKDVKARDGRWGRYKERRSLGWRCGSWQCLLGTPEAFQMIPRTA